MLVYVYPGLSRSIRSTRDDDAAAADKKVTPVRSSELDLAAFYVVLIRSLVSWDRRSHCSALSAQSR